MQFNLTAPSVPGSSFFVRGRLSSIGNNALFTQISVSLNVIGTPTTFSSIECIGNSTQQVLIRPGEAVECLLLPRDSSGALTSAFASDFLAPLISLGYSPSILVTADLGKTFSFSFSTDASLLARVVLTATGALANGTQFTSTPGSVTVVGKPTTASTLYCVGQATSSSLFVYPNGFVNCLIYVRDANGNTTGLPDDFSAPATVGGVNIQPITAVGDNSVMAFTLSAPALANSYLYITGKMANSSLFVQGPVSMLVIGTGTPFSLLSCVALRLGRLNVRAGEDVACTIFPKRSASAFTTANFLNYGTPSIVGGAISSSLVSAANFSQVIFNATATATPGSVFAIEGRMSNLVLFFQGPFYITVVGNPTDASTISCFGNNSGTSFVTVGELTTCYYNMNDNVGPTTGDLTDFMEPIVIGSSNVTALNAYSISQLSFTAVAPLVVGGIFGMTGVLLGGINFTQGFYQLTVVGTPTVASTFTCVGITNGDTFVKSGELILCQIFIKDAMGNTTGVPANFKVFATDSTGRNANQTNLVASSDNSRVFFNLTDPSPPGTIITVAVQIAEGGNFTQGSVQLTVVSTPTTSSTLSCFGYRSGTTFVRVAEVVVCNITARINASVVCSSVPQDFGYPSTINGQFASAPYGTSGFTWQNVNVTSPDNVGQQFSILGTLANGLNFSQGYFNLTVVGTPTAYSNLSCVGMRSGNNLVRINELIVCTITIVDASNATTTGVAADFSTPTVLSGLLQSVVVSSSNLSLASFNVSASDTVGVNVSISAALSSGSSISQSPSIITVGAKTCLSRYYNS